MRKLLSLFALALLFACSSESLEDLRPEGDCDTFDVAYQKDIRALLANNCSSAGCHVGANGVGGLDLTTYADAKAIADNGNLVGRIEETTGNLMPPGAPLADCDIELIRAWVAKGAPNN